MSGPGASALRLGLVTAAVVLTVAASWLATRESIATAEARAERERINAVLPPGPWDRPVHTDWIDAPAAATGTGSASRRIYRARRGGKLHAIAVQAVAPDGYNGAIRLLIGIRADGTLAGVRVLAHRETPGLGDAIEADVSNWIDRFRGRSLGDPAPQRWTVGRPESAFDAFTGATITPRAVVHAVRRTLEWSAAIDWQTLAEG